MKRSENQSLSPDNANNAIIGARAFKSCMIFGVVVGRVARGVRWSGQVAVILVAVIVSGCDLENGEDDGFGKIRSDSGYATVDGISGFVHLLKQRGFSVRTATRISPLIERYNTILWSPDREMPPTEKAIDRLEQWVNGGSEPRALIFIGPGFRGRQWLDKKQLEMASDEMLEKSIRRYSEKLIGGRYQRRYFWGQASGERCRWYELASIDDRPIRRLEGPWSEGLADGTTEVYSGTYEFRIPAALNPSASSAGQSLPSSDRRAEVLLTGDGLHLVYRIPAEGRSVNSFGDEFEGGFAEAYGGEYGGEYGDEYGGVADADDVSGDDDVSGIYVVANGSFVQNFGLIGLGNQRLANRLAGVCGNEVLVLQSGPGAIEVTRSLAPEKNGWAWLGQRPLREIVPFFLLLATVTFFVAFPIHGRPKRIRLRREKTFADHVRATGRLLKSTKGEQWAQDAIKKYDDRTSDKSSG